MYATIKETAVIIQLVLMKKAEVLQYKIRPLTFAILPSSVNVVGGLNTKFKVLIMITAAWYLYNLSGNFHPKSNTMMFIAILRKVNHILRVS
jgi:hypothetical protein